MTRATLSPTTLLFPPPSDETKSQRCCLAKDGSMRNDPRRLATPRLQRSAHPFRFFFSFFASGFYTLKNSAHSLSFLLVPPFIWIPFSIFSSPIPLSLFFFAFLAFSYSFLVQGPWMYINHKFMALKAPSEILIGPCCSWKILSVNSHTFIEKSRSISKAVASMVSFFLYFFKEGNGRVVWSQTWFQYVGSNH